MRISAIREMLSPELKKGETAKKTEPAKSKAAGSDKTEFSSGAKRLSETKAQIDVVATQLSNQPDIRLEKVEEAKQKIRDGFYNTPDFVDKLADKLAHEFGADKS